MLLERDTKTTTTTELSAYELLTTTESTLCDKKRVDNLHLQHHRTRTIIRQGPNVLSDNVTLLLEGCMGFMIITIVCFVFYCSHRNFKKRSSNRRRWLESDASMEVYSVDQFFDVPLNPEPAEVDNRISSDRHGLPPSYDQVIEENANVSLLAPKNINISNVHQHKLPNNSEPSGTENINNINCNNNNINNNNNNTNNIEIDYRNINENCCKCCKCSTKIQNNYLPLVSHTSRNFATFKTRENVNENLPSQSSTSKQDNCIISNENNNKKKKKIVNNGKDDEESKLLLIDDRNKVHQDDDYLLVHDNNNEQSCFNANFKDGDKVNKSIGLQIDDTAGLPAYSTVINCDLETGYF